MMIRKREAESPKDLICLNFIWSTVALYAVDKVLLATLHYIRVTIEKILRSSVSEYRINK